MALARLWLVVSLLSLPSFASRALAEPQHLRVASVSLDAAAPNIHSPHLIVRDPEVTSKHRLVMYLVGTGATADRDGALLEVFARAGYPSIALDYPNWIMTSWFREVKDEAAFDNFRQAINYGGQVRDKLIDAQSGIVARIVSLLQHLARTRADEGWGEYADDGGVHWDKLILVGHSQGSGHVAYIAQRQRVDTVLIIAGPQDYSTALKKPANWLRGPSKTPLDRYRTLLHKDDEYDSKLQLLANHALRGKSKVPVVRLRAAALTGKPRLVVSERAIDPYTADAAIEGAHGLPSPHIAVIQPHAYGDVWLYLLTH